MGIFDKMTKKEFKRLYGNLRQLRSNYMKFPVQDRLSNKGIVSQYRNILSNFHSVFARNGIKVRHLYTSPKISIDFEVISKK